MAMDFSHSVSTEELAGTETARHFVEISWSGSSLTDVRTVTQDGERGVQLNSLTKGEEKLSRDYWNGGWGKLVGPGANVPYFYGEFATPNHILSSFATRISTYADGATLLTAAKPYSICNDDGFFTVVSNRLVHALVREPEHMPASRELLERLDLQRGLGVDRFGRLLGRGIIRDLAPPAEEGSMYDLGLSADQLATAAHAYEAAYGFEDKSFSSPYAYRSFAFSQILYNRLASNKGEAILKAANMHPAQFTGMYIKAVLDAAKQDPTRNTDKLAKIRSRIVTRNNAGEENISFDKLVGVARAVANAQEQQANKTDSSAGFEMFNTASMQIVGDSLALLLSLTHSSEDVSTRNIQQEQDNTHREIVTMLLAPTKRAIGGTVLQARSASTDKKPGV